MNTTVIDLDALTQGGHVPSWLRRFTSDPAASLNDLLIGRAALGVFSAAEPEVLLAGWIRDFDDPSFAALVDETLAAWIDRSWGQFVLPTTADATLTSEAWRRACQVIADSPALERSANTLREGVLSDAAFLAGLTEARSRDPLGRAYFALAGFQSDRRLIEHWWRLVKLPPGELWHRGAYGVRGLLKLPPESPDHGGGWPDEPAEGLRQFGFHLARLCGEGWLDIKVATDEFLRTARRTMLNLPFPDRWQAFWREAAEDRHLPLRAEWLRKLVPPTKAPRQRMPSRNVRPDPSWASQALAIANRLRRADRTAIDDAKRLLDDQGKYAYATGDGHYVVRSACNFATRVRRTDPSYAVEWTELARNFDPWNAHAWAEGADALRVAGRLSDAVHLAIQTVQRFPDNVVARTGLAETLRAAHRLPEAEQVYRETIERFSDNVFARNGLAETLRAAHRLPEAEQVYRETIERFPDNVFARNGLAETLRAAHRLPEAEQVYRETIERFPNDEVARNGLAETLRAAHRLPEAEQVYRETIERFPDDVFARNGLAETLRAAHRLPEAEQVYRETIERFPDDEVARNGLAETLRAAHRLPEAEQVYRETIERFPDDVVSRNALAETLRSQGRLADAEQSFLDALRIDPRDQTAQARLEVVHQEIEAQGPVANPDEIVTPLEEPSSAGSDAEVSTIDHLVQSDIESPGLQAPTRTADQPSILPTLSVSDVTSLLSDAYLLRRWGRRSTPGAADAHADRQTRATELLARLQPWVERDARIAEEAGLLELSTEQWDQAVALLRESARRFPNHPRLHYALARALREQAARQQRRLSSDSERELLTPWHLLARQTPQFRPLSLLGSGRAWLALTDGTTVEEHAREAFGRLGHWITQRLATLSQPADEAEKRDIEPPTFTQWWAGEVSQWLFDAAPPKNADELSDLGPIREQLAAVPRVLDQLEEDWLFRHAPV